MNEKSETLLMSNDKSDKYKEVLNLKFDYEVNNYTLCEKDCNNLRILKKNNEKTSIIGKDHFDDEIVEKFYRCKNISFYKKNWLKSLISKNKIRFTNNKFDLDLV